MQPSRIRTPTSGVSLRNVAPTQARAGLGPERRVIDLRLLENHLPVVTVTAEVQHLGVTVEQVDRREKAGALDPILVEIIWMLIRGREQGHPLFEQTTQQPCQDHGIANVGYRAVEACRLEKGYVYWSGDVGPDVNPYEAGLGFCVDLDKGDFTGRDALARANAI